MREGSRMSEPRRARACFVAWLVLGSFGELRKLCLPLERTSASASGLRSALKEALSACLSTACWEPRPKV